MTQLKKSEVCFNEVEHTYTLDGKQLSGITSILRKYLFADKYKDVPEYVLNKAAERGTLIHSQMQMWINGMPFAEQEPGVHAMQMIVSGDKFVESEFTVSDNESVASQIDAVAELEDGTYELWDWKSTSVLDFDYLSWQLSIYAYLFERQTGCVVSSLMVGHIRETAKAEKVDRINDEYVEALLKAFKEGADTFDGYRAVKKSESLPALDNYQAAMMHEAENFENCIAELEAKVKSYKEKYDTLKEELLKEMESHGILKLENERMLISYKKASVRDGIDTKKLKAEKPDIYQEYYKPSNVKASVTIKIK